MKVKLNVGMSGTRNGEEWPPRGSVVDLPEDEAKHLVAAGLAVQVEAPVVEAAVAAPVVEKASVAAAPKRRGKN